METKLTKEYIDRLKLIYSENEIGTINKGFNNQKRLVTFRTNLLKSTNLEIENALKKAWLKFKKIAYLKNAYKLLVWIERNLWKLDIYKKWQIYIQWISSQLPVLFLDITNSSKILDPSVAPWSKVSQISSELNNKWEIIWIDNNQIRIDKLKYNLKKLWIKNVKVIKYNSSRINLKEYEEYFDNILFDAPCSSDWRFNLNIEKSYKFWNLKIVKNNYKIQKYILKNIISTLKKWWTLIYSTCSLSPEENEWIVHFILSNFSDIKIIDITNKLKLKNSKPWITKFWDIVYRKDVSKSIRILPNKDMEWFFIAKFIKK